LFRFTSFQIQQLIAQYKQQILCCLAALQQLMMQPCIGTSYTVRSGASNALYDLLHIFFNVRLIM